MLPLLGTDNNEELALLRLEVWRASERLEESCVPERTLRLIAAHGGPWGGEGDAAGEQVPLAEGPQSAGEPESAFLPASTKSS